MWVAGATGCATPQGVLFPLVDPPLVWPTAPDVPRVKFVGTLNGSADLKAALSASEAFKAFLRGPRPPINFSGPHGIALCRAGRARLLDARGAPGDTKKRRAWPALLAVADGAGGAVHILDLGDRTHVLVTGFGDERFSTPLGVAWADRRLFVTDAQRHEVVELDAEGGYHGRFGLDTLTRPVGITYVAQRDRLYVVDGGAHRVVVFDPAGTVVQILGERGTAPGQFNFPTHITSRGDRLLVADSGNSRIQLLDLDGRPLSTIGSRGDGAGDLSLPKGVAFDSAGRIYVVDAHFENVQIFDETGQLLLAIGREGNRLGQFALPAGLAIDRSDRIWVADSGNRRLQVFSLWEAPS